MEADSSPCAGVRPGSGDAIASAAARSPATEMGLEAFARGPLFPSSHRGPSCLLFFSEMRGFLGSWPILRWVKEMALLVGW